MMLTVEMELKTNWSFEFILLYQSILLYLPTTKHMDDISYIMHKQIINKAQQILCSDSPQ